jgi:hypothetical protein
VIVEPPRIPTAYLVPVNKPVPEASGRAVIVELIKKGADGRAFVLYIDALSASWDNLYQDRLAVRRLVDANDKESTGNP